MEQQSQQREVEESSHRSPDVPILCANDCGFFGSAATNNLCSKCYRDFVLKQRQSSAAVSSIAEKEKSVEPPSVEFPVKVEGNQEACASSEDPVNPPKNRCDFCRKRVSLTGFKCRCGQTFCPLHRYSDSHNCSFDYKKAGREEIARANPVVKADKIDQI